MIGKKINQLATELAPVSTDLTIIGDPISGVSKKITLAQLGAIFSGAVSFYTNLAGFPSTGDINVIYCAKDTQKLYLWSGSAYTEVFPSQALLDTYQLRSEKGVSNGYASLDSTGKVPISQLPSSIMEYKGTWNAATNTPTLANGTGDTGDVYICNVAGTVNFGAGPITFAVGDYVIYSGTIWQRSSGAVGTVTSVAASITGNAIGITGSPVTTSGTLAFAFAGTGAQYIKGDGTLATFPSTIAQAERLITEVYNSTGATLTKGTIVYINGGQGNLPTVTKALATGDSTSAQTFGVVQADITNNNNGYVVVAGKLSDLDTQAYTPGTPLYLSSTTAGTWTSTKQYAPNHLVYIGVVVRAHPTQGIVEIKIQNGYELDELHDVAAQNPDNNDILQYKTSTSLWTKVAGTTSNIAEGSNLYYTDARSRAALSFTAGSGAYNSTTGVITIPTNTNQLTNGANYITLGSLSASSPLSYNNTTGAFSISQANSTTNGFLSSTDWNTFNSKQAALTFSSPLVNTAGTISIPAATSSVNGYLTSTDWITFNSKQNALNGTGFVKISGTTISYDNSTYYLASNPNAYIALTNLSAGAGISYNNTTGVIASTITQYTDAMARAAISGGTGISYNSTTGVITNTITQYTDAMARSSISLTTTGTSGAATYNSTTGVLNVPQYAPDLSGYVPTSRTLTINGTAFDLSANRSWSVGTVTSVGLSSATSGVTIGSTPITTSGTITLAIATASGSQQGLLSSTDWTTFNNKQNALTNPVTGTGTTNYLPKFTGTSTIGNSAVYESGGSVSIGGTSMNVTGLNVQTSGTNLTGTTAYVNINAAVSGYGLSIGGDSTRQAGVISGYQGIDFYTYNGGWTRSLTLDYVGNLGLGVTPSAWWSGMTAMQIGTGGGVYSANATNDIYLVNNAFFDGTNFRYVNSDFAGISGWNGGQFQWVTAPSGTAGNAISFTQAMTLNASGNLSIGNTNDTYKLDVSGTGIFRNNLTLLRTGSNDQLLIKTSSTNGTRIGHDALGLYISNDDTTLDILRLYGGTSGSLKLTIASTGAATFSSSVTANSGNFESGYSGGGFKHTVANFGIYANSTTFNISNWNTGVGLQFVNSTGAATFSSSVTATQSLILNGTNPNFDLRNSGSTYFRAELDGSNFTYLSTFGANDMILRTNATERMRITSGGQLLLGISSTPETSRLFVKQAQDFDYRGVMVESAATGGFIGSMSIDASGNLSFAQSYTSGSGSYKDIRFVTSNVERARITSGGRVGIGTSSPSYTFDVNKQVDADFVARISNPSTSGFGLYVQSNDNTKPGIRIANASGGTAIDLLGSGAGTFTGDVKVKTLEVTNVTTYGSSAGISTYMQITVNGNNYVIPLHGTP